MSKRNKRKKYKTRNLQPDNVSNSGKDSVTDNDKENKSAESDNGGGESGDRVKGSKRLSRWKKILLICGISVLAIILVLAIVIAAIWHNEISTVASIELIVDAHEENKSAPVYIMDVSGDYYFDKFIEQGGASDDGELIQFVVDNITKGIVPININSPNIGCSSFTCVDADGNRYFGRNYDFSTTTSMIVRTDPGNGRYASISSVDLQFLGITDGVYLDSLMQKLICLAATYAPLDGINEAGVSCGIYMSYQGAEGEVVATDQSTDKPDLTSTTMLRLILDYAGSVDEAVALVSKYDLHDSANTSFHYMVADSTGRSAILEWVAADDATDTDGTKRTLRVYYNDDDSVIGKTEAANEFQYITNFIVTPDYYSGTEDMKGLDRYNEIAAVINPDGTNTEGLMTKEDALEVLKTVGRRRWDSRNGESDSNGITVWSALYDLTNRTVTWVSNEEFDNSDSVFTFDFSYLN
ncbi:MAG: linear amide C-N hydrolase [Clostridia bacterium]|nr:linear amide C-N hydrolase [Clostridia bacterium]